MRLLRDNANLVDGVLRDIWQVAGVPDAASLIAVGGYGRGQLFPNSDVDLLILLAEEPDRPTQQRIERLVGLFWDIGLEVGHSVRTLEECAEESARDVTVQTNLLEARLLAGDAGIFERMLEQQRAALDLPAFFIAKRAEQEQRYNRFNDTPYSLEPNCKEGPGGQRDLQTIVWIALASGLGASWESLATEGLITAEECRELSKAERFLQEVRIRLHLLTRRREDRLLFDHQEALAKALGVSATSTRRASEVMMQRYYLVAKKITQLNTLLLQNFATRILPAGLDAPIPIDDRFCKRQNLLDVFDDSLFTHSPDAILDAFLLLERHDELKGMTARTLRALWQCRGRVDAAFRRKPENRKRFLELFQQPQGITHVFRWMNQYGILGRYIPAFGQIVGQMQHDLFHVYTVDQHILQVMRNVRRMTMDEHAHEYPLCTRLISGLDRHWLLYVAALFHDIAKGRGGDHSKLGMGDARRFCEDHGLSADDTDLVEWLVEHHLTMSQIAQKSDLSDPDVIRGFAALVGDERRLTALYLLTHADIRGTSPKVWNGWKAKLLEDLFLTTQRLLRGDTPVQAKGVSERQHEARTRLRFFGLIENVERALWDELDTVYFMRHDIDEIVWHTRMLYYRPSGGDAVVKARPSQIERGLQVMVYAPDSQDLFKRLCGFFSRHGLSILDAKIHTTRHGYALDSFVLLDPAGDENYRDIVPMIEHDLAERLRTNAPIDKPGTGRLSRQVRHFPITPEVTIRPDERGQYYILSVATADRPGLLFDIASVLADNRVDLHTAKIATLGERAEDTFLISGPDLDATSAIVKLEGALLAKV
ncbi:[protein-PII] uridylyltransferase [Niveibacterium umoris]|uniref:Bifunctional uridylyltransferase/uridylyl-removing enzyme n=1 Tax=Niveibacterium umoris TaxID=1193620 RepID=A0A840BM14_9RHOO|nr:[protein-PII] uridylyltransferase [Niveibacterium umoris]